MHFLCAALVKEFGGLAQLGPPDNGVVNQQQLFAADQRVHGNQLHFRNQVALALVLGHEGTGPGRRVFDERACKGDAGFIGITDGMGDS